MGGRSFLFWTACEIHRVFFGVVGRYIALLKECRTLELSRTINIALLRSEDRFPPGLCLWCSSRQSH